MAAHTPAVPFRFIRERSKNLLRSIVAAACALSATATPAACARPELDLAAVTPPPAALSARLAGLRADPALSPGGRPVQVDARYGVPSFVWGAGAAPAAASTHAPAAAGAPGPSAEQAARAHLAGVAAAYGLDDADVRGAALRELHDTGQGGIIASFRQVVDGVEVFRDEVKVLMNRDLALVAIAGSIPGHAEAGAPAAREFRLPAAEAVGRALDDFTGSPFARGAIRAGGAAAGGYDTFEASAPGPAVPAGLSPSRPVRARRVLFHLPGELVPAWYVEVVAAEDAVAYVVSARDGSLLFRHDLVAYDSFAYRVWADGTAAHEPFDGPQGPNPSPHPTGLPDFYAPPLIAPSLVTQQNGPISTHDPWLPPGALETSGNNVDAYADLAAPDGFSAGDLRASVTSPNAFDRVYDTNLPPDASADQQMAAITQIFYVDNFLHDWYYDSGFDEKAGNAQLSNYGRGGVEGDPFLAEGQDYSFTNNANMMTPADGGSPRQQMFVFLAPPGRHLAIDAPPSLAGPMAIGDASSNPAVFSVSADVVLPNPGTFSVQATTPYASGSGLEWVTIADLNGDGHPDLATANFLSNDVSVLLSDGAGGFAAPVAYPMGSGPYTVAASDLDHDGKLDLVCANETGSTFSVRLGTGGGAFGPKTDFATGSGATDAAIGRLNADANDDVVVSNIFSNSVSVFLGNGAGGFGPKTDYPVGANPNWVEIADLNGDGKNDLVTANLSAGTISVLLGDGAGGFGPKTDYPAGSFPLTLAVGDLNGDHRPDIVTANSGANTVAVLLGDGAGGFGSPTAYPVPAAPVTVRLGDANGDGILDVAVCCDASNSVSILRGDGSGALGAATSFPVGTTPYAVQFGDVTGDGQPDLVSANYGSNDVTVLAGLVTPVPELCPPFANSLAGRIAVIDRGNGGSCFSFGSKIQAAQSAGAAGVLIANNVAGAPTAMPITVTVNVPAFMIGQSDGNAIKAALRLGPVRATLSSVAALTRDGTIDGQTIAHEWGHYLSNRLIANASGLTNDQGLGMGEGWGDFSALLMTVRPEDALAPAGLNFSGCYAIAGYALSSTATPTNAYYFGFRRYPYSIDFTRNPLTFQDIQNGVPLPAGPPVQFGADGATNSEAHNAGEVWCTMLWECYAALLRDSGRLTFAQACDRMRGYLVASLKMTPPSPTFVEARDAVLAAALANDLADYGAFCSAFARRGMGTGAVAPDRASTDNAGVVESYACGAVAVDPPPVARLEFALRGSNPVAVEAQFAFALPRASDARLDVFSVAGRRVATLVEGRLEAGIHSARWAVPPAAGVYFARLSAVGESRVLRVVVTR